MDSLRQKITFGYYGIGALIVGLSLFAYVELRLIEEGRVLAGERISEFFDTTLVNHLIIIGPAHGLEPWTTGL